ncbi:MAG: hypothetical protein HY774_18270 [Acidobacteria bacterium]|nr:hypothetical protein [Acidobacteriota bacterium]
MTNNSREADWRQLAARQKFPNSRQFHWKKETAEATLPPPFFRWMYFYVPG